MVLAHINVVVCLFLGIRLMIVNTCRTTTMPKDSSSLLLQAWCRHRHAKPGPYRVAYVIVVCPWPCRIGPNCRINHHRAGSHPYRHVSGHAQTWHMCQCFIAMYRHGHVQSWRSHLLCLVVCAAPVCICVARSSSGSRSAHKPQRASPLQKDEELDRIVKRFEVGLMPASTVCEMGAATHRVAPRPQTQILSDLGASTVYQIIVHRDVMPQTQA